MNIYPLLKARKELTDKIKELQHDVELIDELLKGDKHDDRRINSIPEDGI